MVFDGTERIAIELGIADDRAIGADEGDAG